MARGGFFVAGWGLSYRQPPSCQRAAALWTPAAARRFASRTPKAKGMKDKKASKEEKKKRDKSVTVRLTSSEKRRLKELHGPETNKSDYIRSRIFGGRPIIAKTDHKMIGLLSKLGGLLKSNFQTLRQANAGPDQLRNQEEVLRKIGRLIDELSGKTDDSQKN